MAYDGVEVELLEDEPGIEEVIVRLQKVLVSDLACEEEVYVGGLSDSRRARSSEGTSRSLKAC